MKKRFLKSILAVLTALCLLMTALVPTVLAADFPNAEDLQATCPTVSVHGFMAADIYRNPGTEQEEIIWPPSGDAILTMVKGLLAPIAEFGVTRNWDKLGDTLSVLALDLLGPAFNNPDGTCPENTGINWSYPSDIPANGEVGFRYDWREDPVLAAGQLNDFINYVLDETGAEQVCLDCHSMGGIVVVSYLALYGRDKVKGIVFDASALFGETYTEELFLGKMEIDGEALYEFLKYTVYNTEYEKPLNLLFDALFAAGAFDVVECLGKSILEHLAERAAIEVLLPMFGCWPGVWAMLPDAAVDDAFVFVFGNILRNADNDYTVLREKLVFYNENVRAVKTALLQDAYDNGRLGVFSRYGFCSIPVTPSWRNLSDGTVDTKYSSFGATTANYNETLSPDYVEQHREQGYLSPDLMVDASTCLFPDNTWFVKNLPHSRGADEMDALKRAIFFAAEPVTIRTYAEYPQYMLHTADGAVPFTEYEEPSPNYLAAYGRLMQKLRDMFKALLEKFIYDLRSRIPALYDK